MNYSILERAYGPDIRGCDWRVESGKVECSGGELHLLGAEAPAVVTRQDYPHGGGGDVALRVTFSFDELAAEGQLTVHWNRANKQSEAQGFQITLGTRKLVCRLKDRELAQRPSPLWRCEEIHSLKLVTLAEEFALYFDEAIIAEGQMPPPFTDNEGFTTLSAQQAHVRIIAYEELFIVHDRPCPAWQKKDCLADLANAQAPLKQQWIWNGAPPVPVEGGWTFHPLSVCVLREQFAGPLLVEFRARPEPTTKFSAGVTDAIFIWMMNRPGGGLLHYLASLPNADLQHYLPLSFYWIDFGGTNNTTTRLRKHPQRQLRRQFTDRARLLQRQRTYTIGLVQHGDWVEFWVDGTPWIQAFDPHPCQTGHIAFRAFVAALTITDLKIWRLSP